MRTLKKTISLAMTVGLAGAAQAAVDPGELTVGGQVKTPVCVVTMDDGGVFDYGVMSSSQLPATGHLPLEARTKTVSVDCGTGTTYLSFWPTDNRDGTASGRDEEGRIDGAYGLGRMRGRPASMIGYYTVIAGNAKVDGRNVLAGTYSVSGRRIYSASRRRLRHKVGTYDYIAMTWGSVTGWSDISRMVSGSRFEIDLEVTPYLASYSVVGGGAPITEQVVMDGSTTLTFKFGL